MTFDEITQERRALHEQGGIELREVSRTRGVMVASDPTNYAAQRRAERYNELADMHAKLKA